MSSDGCGPEQALSHCYRSIWNMYAHIWHGNLRVLPLQNAKDSAIMSYYADVYVQHTERQIKN